MTTGTLRAIRVVELFLHVYMYRIKCGMCLAEYLYSSLNGMGDIFLSTATIPEINWCHNTNLTKPPLSSSNMSINTSYYGSDFSHSAEKIFPWEKEAAHILKVYKPKCIVLDLDFTLWPTFYSANTLPPYVSLTHTPSQVLCVDKKTLKPRMLSLYPEVQATIRFCLENDIMISIASKNTNRQDAESILKSFGLWHLMVCPQIYLSRKSYHFRNLKSATGLEYADFMFFDDDVKNVSVCGGMGVNSMLVNRGSGFCGKRLVEGLRQGLREMGGDGGDLPVQLPLFDTKVLSTSSSSSESSDDEAAAYA